jgi:hypothetical protein
MMAARSFTTSTGARGRTQSRRRFVVVHSDRATVQYRTDVLGRAIAFRAAHAPASHEVIDTEPGQARTVWPAEQGQ